MKPPFEFKIEDKFLPLLHEQVWEVKDKLERYTELTIIDFEQIKDHLPQAPKVVMDFGTGIGRAAIYHNWLNPGAHYILADRDGDSKNNTGNYNPHVDEYYNDLTLTGEFCKLNGLESYQTFDTETGDWSKLPPVDFIMSHYSLGFHVSFERYLERLLSVLAPGGVVIIGCRHQYIHKDYSKYFKSRSFIETPSKPPLPNQHWLILKDPIKP